MNWLRKIWDKHGWLMMPPLILVIGFLIIFAVGLSGRLISLFFTKIPFVIWGNLTGFSILVVVGFHLKSLSRESKLGLGWHLTGSIGVFNFLVAAAAIFLMVAAISSFVAPERFSDWWHAGLAILGSGILLVVMFVYVFVCGEFLAKAVIFFRRKQFSGLFFVAVAGVGLSAPGFLIYERFEAYYLAGNWPGMILMAAASILIVGGLMFWFVLRAFEVDKWTLEDKVAPQNVE